MSDQKLTWGAEYVGPGSHYLDEPTEMVPPGWYVRAWRDDGDIPAVTVHVLEAVSDSGDDIRHEIAPQVAIELALSQTVRDLVAGADKAMTA